jgi:hypothetical protein
MPNGGVVYMGMLRSATDSLVAALPLTHPSAALFAIPIPIPIATDIAILFVIANAIDVAFKMVWIVFVIIGCNVRQQCIIATRTTLCIYGYRLWVCLWFWYRKNGVIAWEE